MHFRRVPTTSPLFSKAIRSIVKLNKHHNPSCNQAHKLHESWTMIKADWNLTEPKPSKIQLIPGKNKKARQASNNLLELKGFCIMIGSIDGKLFGTIKN